MDIIEKVMRFLITRKQAYQGTFNLNDFGNQMVLADLMVFCRGNESCVIPGDTHTTAVLEGRREVWLRIQNHLHLTPDQMYQLYHSKGNPQ